MFHQTQSRRQQHDNQITTRQKTLSRMASNLGPNIPSTLIEILQKESITHLNLHSNSIESLGVSLASSLDSVHAIDLSSNQLGCGCKSSNLSSFFDNDCELSSILSIVPNLQSLNLSANSLSDGQLEQILLGSTAHNLTALDLSHNDLNRIPYTLVRFCPRLTHLNLNDNDIQDLKFLEQFSTLKYLESINIESNPICCNDVLYKEKLIFFFGQTLVQCNGMMIKESDREHARTSLMKISETTSKCRADNDSCHRNRKEACSTGLSHTKNGINGNNLKNTCNKRQSVQCFHKTSSPLCVRTGRIGSNNSNNDAKMIQRQRMRKSVETMSLHKLNSLETQVRQLSKLAVEQVEATNQLLSGQDQCNNDNNLSRKVENNVSDSEQVPIVCNANVQTSFTDYKIESPQRPIPCPLDEDRIVMMKEINRMHLVAAILKWKNFTLKVKLRGSKRGGKDEHKNNVKDVVREVVEQIDTLRDAKQKYHEEQQSHVLEIKKREDIISNLNNEITQLKGRIVQHDLEIQCIHREITSRLEKFQTESINRVKKERDEYHENKFKEADAQFRKDREDLERVLAQQTIQIKYFEQTLSKNADTLKENEIRVASYDQKMKDVKKTFEIMTARSADDKVKLECAKGAIKEAAHIARQRQKEVNVLRSEIEREKEMLRVSKIGESDSKSRNILLEKEIERSKLKERELEAILNQKNKDIDQCRDQISLLQRDIKAEQSENNRNKEKIISIKKEYKGVIKDCAALKKELLSVASFKKEKIQKNEESAEMIIKFRQSNKNLKRETRQLKLQIGSLEEHVQSKDLTIASLSKQLYTSKRDHASFESKIVADFENYFYQTREKYHRELLTSNEHACKLEKEVIISTSEKEYLEKKVASLTDQVELIRKEKLSAEKKLVVVQQSLEEQAMKTQEALQSICVRVSPRSEFISNEDICGI